jgi:alkylhydroperoxidase family enzyme
MENDMTETMAQIAAREAEVLGQPPRMPPLDRQSVAEEVLAATAHIRGGVVGANAPLLALDAIPEIMFILCRFPELWGRLMDVSIQMQSATGVLAARDRQLAILRTAWLLQAPYEWGEHVRHSHKAGITPEEVERVTVGSTAKGWSDHERAIMRAAEELREGAMVSDATWGKLAETLSEAQLFEVLVVIGHFTNIAYMQNSMRIRLEPSNPGLVAR